MDELIPFSGATTNRSISVEFTDSELTERPTISKASLKQTSKPQSPNDGKPSLTSGPTSYNVSLPVIGTATTAQQPKILTNAFIHKLYKYSALDTELVLVC